MNSEYSKRDRDKAILNLNNFLHSYNLSESTVLLNLVSDYITEGVHFATLDQELKEKIIDYLESLEELLPAIYVVYKGNR